MSRHLSARRLALALAAFTALAVLPAAVLAPAAHAQKARKGAAKKPAGKSVKFADVGLSFTLPNGYGPVPEELQSRVGELSPEVKFLAVGPRTTRFDATKYAAYNTTLTTWMYNTVVLEVEPVPVKGLTDIAQLSPEDEQDIKRTLEGGGAGGRGSGIRVENTARGKVGGKNALFIGGHRDLPGREETFRHRLCLIVHEGRLYTFDFATDIESFPTTSRAFERLLASVRWGKPTVPAPKPSSSSPTVAEAGQ